MSSITNIFSSVSIEVASGILLVVTGLVLWAAGRRVMRAALAAGAFALFAILGLGLGLSLESATGVPAWILAIVTGLTGACMAALGHRWVVMSILMVVFATAAPIGVWTVTGQQAAPYDESSDPPDDEAEAASVGTVEDFLEQLPDAEVEGAPEGFEDRWLENLGTVGSELGWGEKETIDKVVEARQESLRAWDWVQRTWEQTPPRLRTTIVAVTLIGLLSGVLIGTVLPGFSTSIVTSVGGGLMMLVGGVNLSAYWAASYLSILPDSALDWAIWWGGISIVGLGIQWMHRPRKADKPG